MLSQFYEFIIKLIFTLAARLTRIAKVRPAALDVATPSPDLSDPTVLVGERIFSARERLRQSAPVCEQITLTTEERFKHIYSTGVSGGGKTTALVNTLMADIKARRGVIYFDFVGDNFDKVLARLADTYTPDELEYRLLIYDLRLTRPDGTVPDYVMGLDVLRQGANPYTQAMAVMDMIRRHCDLPAPTEEVARSIILAMTLSPLQPPLADIELFLTSPEARARLLVGVDDPTLRRFFARFDALPNPQAWVGPVINKLGPILALPNLRLFLGNPNALSLRDFLDSRADPIVLVALGADQIFGAATLMGSLLLSCMASCIMRSGRPARPATFIYLDEAHRLAEGTGELLEMMIAELRRYKGGLYLAHQSISQLPPKLRSIIRNSVSTHLILSSGGIDSETLAGEIASDEPKAVLKQILLGLRPGEALLTRRGMVTVKLKTVFMPDPVVASSAVEALCDASLRRHGRPRAEVEAEIREREETFFQSKSSDAQPDTGDAKGASATVPPPRRTRRKSPSASRYEVCDEEALDTGPGEAPDV